MNVIKQYGLERSGTNYIKALLEINLQDTFVCASMFGPKHYKFEPVPEGYHPLNDPLIRHELDTDQADELVRKFKAKDVYYVVSVKNPFSWVMSYRRFIKRHKLEGEIDLSIESLVSKWNEYNLDWIEKLGSHPSRFFLVEYESLLFNPEKIVKQIAGRFGIPQAGCFFQNIENSMIEGVDVHGSKNVSGKVYDEHEYYKTKGYMDELTHDEVNYINDNADFRIINIF